MGHRVHGLQEGRHCNGYYDGYILSPLSVFAGDVPLWAALLPGDADAGFDGVIVALAAIVPALRRRCKRPASSCAATAPSPVKRRWPGAKSTKSITVLASPPTHGC